ncbi:MAG: hypothetical protein QXU98_04185 [Candidatus Parvarchaeota archaeon]
MKSEHLGILDGIAGGLGAGTSLLGREYNVALLKNQLVDLGIGGALFLLGYFTHLDGLSDFIETYGAGFIVGSVL